MSDSEAKITELEARLDALVRSQIAFQSQISAIRAELSGLRAGNAQYEPRPNSGYTADEPSARADTRPAPSPVPATTGPEIPIAPRRDNAAAEPAADKWAMPRRDLEKFIGENLLSKVGIIVLILGVGIGAKYAIDNGWITPLMRVVAGYVIGFALIAAAVRLRPKYVDFSAVLLSGGTAIMYFVTYFAFAYYSLMPRSVAFGLMAIFTWFAVATALFYNRQVIAHIGLVGAYAVPFLLSSESGNYLLLFSYMALINCGILAISIRKFWKLLYYTAFAATWGIYFTWYVARYNAAEDMLAAFAFVAIFFGVFYAATLVHGVLHPDHSGSDSSLAVISNSLVFYAAGYSLMQSRAETQSFLGLFTAGHAVLHLAACQAVKRSQPLSVALLQALVVLAVTFATIAIPVQFDGHVVTAAWAAEAAVLFWFGRRRGTAVFETLSYPLIVLSSFSLYLDWIWLYDDRTAGIIAAPIFNGVFVTGLFFAAAMAFTWRTNSVHAPEPGAAKLSVGKIGIVLGTLTALALYNTFRIEIGNYYHLRLAGTQHVYLLASLLEPSLKRPADGLVRFNAIWQFNYTLGFIALVQTLNLKWRRSAFAAFASLGSAVIILAAYLTVAMFIFYELRVSYMSPDMSIGEPAGVWNIVIRYVSYLFAAALLFTVNATSASDLVAGRIGRKAAELCWDALLFTTIFIIASSELINLMAQAGLRDSTKLGLSILWGIYSLSMIACGIALNKKHLRVAAIALLALTLIKLFVYDVADLPTIPKTILFVTLGLTLLVISFLYNKFAAKIFGRPATET